MLFPKKGGGLKCNKCGHEPESVDAKPIRTEMTAKETVILEDDDVSSEPTMTVECPKCGHMKAHWILRQTRRSDEPETRILTCAKCKHRWREY